MASRRTAQRQSWQKVLLEAIDLGARDVRVGLFSGQHKLVYVTRSKRVTRKALSETDRRELLEWALSMCGISDYGILTAGESVRTTQHVGRFRIEFSLQVLSASFAPRAKAGHYRHQPIVVSALTALTLDSMMGGACLLDLSSRAIGQIPHVD